LLLGIGSVFVLLKLVTPTLAMQQPGNANTQLITGTVTLWYAYTPGGNEEMALTQVISNALAENPGLIVTATYISFADIYNVYETEVISGGGPDMFVASNDNLGSEARLGVISNLDDYLQGRLTDVYTTAIEGMKVNGELYGVPESAKANVLFYNNSTITTPITTTADLLALVQGGKNLVIPNGDGGGPYFNFGFFGAFGGQLLDSTGRCIAKDGGFAPAMQYLVDLKNAGAAIITDTWGQGYMPFCAGDIDLLIDGIWDLNGFQACLGNDLGAVLIPAGPVDVAKPMTGIDGFYVNPNTSNFTATVELALFMTNQASTQIFTEVGEHAPVRMDVTPTNPILATFAQAAAQGWPRYQGLEMNAYWGPFGNMMNNVLGETVSPATGVTIACDDMNWYNGFDQRFYLPAIHR
jgi:arabinogalactan oligomer / maltooligosaccharide transport system substrate-binding protein